MVNLGTALLCLSPQAFIIYSLLAVVGNTEAAGAWVQQGCPPFSCGHLQGIQYPFRQKGDPSECGVQSYEIICSDARAIIHINTGRYYVTNIFYNNSTFWAVDANAGNSSCPVPRWDQLPYSSSGVSGSDGNIELATVKDAMWVLFVNCSKVINSPTTSYAGWYGYPPVTCHSAKNSFVYAVRLNLELGQLSDTVESVPPSCGYLGIIPAGDSRQSYILSSDDDVVDVRAIARFGFAVRFPFTAGQWKLSKIITTCLADSIRHFKAQFNGASIWGKGSSVIWSEMYFLRCVYGNSGRPELYWPILGLLSAIEIVKYIIVLAILLRFVLAPLAVWIFLAHRYWKTRITIDAVEKFLQMQETVGPMRFAYTDIVAITSHFGHKLGQGGYGSVYRGMLPGDVNLAVKILCRSMCNGEDFISEVSTIGRIHHVNVVRLVGYCSEEPRRALVYEYMPKGSLDKYIFSGKKRFSWDKLSEIGLGIARGIDYLHRGCDMQILHFDIKPHNILLDSNFVPKVADFGLAKLYPRDNSFVPLSAARGTIGYIAPEMISRSFGVVSSKSDVYSFGMLLLEMVGGRRNAAPDQNSSLEYYPSWVYDRLTEGRELGQTSAAAAADMHVLERKLCLVAMWCIQMKSQDRPTMREVVRMLDGSVDDLQIPPRPFFCDEEHSRVGDSHHFYSELTSVSEEDE
ncbi:LEAF RUST 10 DISEASE-RESISTANCEUS RECEPTOR-LIKE PROTEIN KINASE-like 2.5 [Aegilops tauschii subsp. strangulata]|uniref:Protein kinase domain-containing protein n=4 Tax=Aegilops tauschii subsp. strangulata TaxID=200361 RepID=A0A453LMU9_AEGTS|nr:rust resistance kinase Lr10 [Aegilops tauschii subsp. strangulata]